MNSSQNLSKKNKILIFVSVVIIAISLLTWWQHTQTEQQKTALERERIGNAFRQAGIAAAKTKVQQSTNNPVETDGNAPHELTDEAELAQAKLWLSLPKDKRAIMQIETTQAGLAAKSDNK